MVGIVNKPDINYGIWASNGDVAVPSSEKVEIGHIVEKPKKEIVNWIENRQDQFMAYLNQVGIPEWDSKTTYKANVSFVNRSGTVYKAKSQNIDKDPTLNQDIWGIAWSTYEDYSNLYDEVQNIKGVEGYLGLYVSKNSPVMLGEAKGIAYNDSTGVSGLSFNELTPQISNNGVNLAVFQEIDNLSEPSKKVVTMDVLLQVLQNYKVGDIYLTTNQATPDVTLGYGTWERYGEGRALVGVSTKASDPDWTKGISSLYGAYTHKLSVDEIPSHKHGITGGGGEEGDNRYPDSTASTIAATTQTDNTGGDQPHNNVQPSITVFVWRRTS